MKNQFVNRAPAPHPHAEPQETSTDGQVEAQSQARPVPIFKAPFTPPSPKNHFPPNISQQLSPSTDPRANTFPAEATPPRHTDPSQHASPYPKAPYKQEQPNAFAPFPQQARIHTQATQAASYFPPPPLENFAPPPGFAPPAGPVPNFSQPASSPMAPAQPQRPPVWYERDEDSYPNQRPPVWPQTPPNPQPREAPWQNMAVQPKGRHHPAKAKPTPTYRHTPASPLVSLLPVRRGLPIWSRILLATLAVLLVCAGGGYAYYQINYGNTISNITNQQVIHHNLQGAVVTPAANNDVLTGNRLNILLLGSDTDGKSAPLAQTDIIITIDPQTQYVGMLSIPRDLRLYAPKAGAIKLDEAFSTGWNLPGDNHYGNAVGSSIDTIQQNFGIPINFSAWVGLDGFVKVIDTVGGIDVDVLHPMTDDIYPNDVNNQNGLATDYKRLYIAPGPQHLDGIHALEYVRTRHSDGQADFGRSIRQQQILSQLKNKLTQIDVARLPQLIQDLNGHVKTDMQITDIPKLMNFAKGIDPNKIDKLVLSAPYSVPASTVYPRDTSTDYIPVCAQILPKIQQMFALGNNATCPTVGARFTFPNTLNTAATANTVTTAPSATTMTTTDAWRMLGASTPTTTLSLSMASQDPSDVHSLLNLMLLTAFQSFDTLGA